jgi:hypothetical protein
MSMNSDTTTTRREIEREREALVAAVGELRARVGKARREPVRPRAGAVAAVALAGFVVAGGVHSTVRLLGTRERRRRQRF